jgi:hypothetical protein
MVSGIIADDETAGCEEWYLVLHIADDVTAVGKDYYLVL